MLVDELVQVKAETADKGVAVLVDQHVVGMEFRQSLEVGVQNGAAVFFPPQQTLAHHRDDKEPAIGKPADTRRTVVDLQLHARGAVRRGARDAVLVEVGVPESPLVPAQALAEIQTFDEWLRFHGRLPIVLRNAGGLEASSQTHAPACCSAAWFTLHISP